jgi:hypothetical protein
MNLVRFILVATSCAFLFGSCKKNTDSTNNSTKFKVKTYTEDLTSDPCVQFFSQTTASTDVTYTDGIETYTGTHTYTFDASSRIIKDSAILSNGGKAIKSYTYF